MRFFLSFLLIFASIPSAFATVNPQQEERAEQFCQTNPNRC